MACRQSSSKPSPPHVQNRLVAGAEAPTIDDRSRAAGGRGGGRSSRNPFPGRQLLFRSRENPGRSLSLAPSKSSSVAPTGPSQGGKGQNTWILGLGAPVSPPSRKTRRLRSRRLCGPTSRPGRRCLPTNTDRIPGSPITGTTRGRSARWPAMSVLPWVHRVFSLMKRWGLATYHGLRRKHIDTYPTSLFSDTIRASTGTSRSRPCSGSPRAITRRVSRP